MALMRGYGTIPGRGSPNGVVGSGGGVGLLLLYYTSGREDLGQKDNEPKQGIPGPWQPCREQARVSCIREEGRECAVAS